MSHESPPAVSETARERETFKYDNLALSFGGLKGPQPPKSIPSSFLSSTPDPGLTAFAQLGLYRLNASRAMISLFDRRYQHIVAEALRPPLPGAHDQAEPVWCNGLTFERATSICEHVVTGAAASQSIPGTTAGLGLEDLPVSIITHVHGDVRSCNITDPTRQFYAGVPVRTPTGINIGVYCVFDDKPRPHGLVPEEVRFIRDMSKVVMDYLESKRSHELYRRGERMLRGLGSFVEGGDTLLNSAERTLDRKTSFQDLPGLGEGAFYRGDQSETTSKDSKSESGLRLETSTRDNETPAPTTGSPHDKGNGGVATVSKPSPTTTVPSAQPARPPLPKSPPSSIDVLQGNVERVFHRASNVIRESIDVEGVLFLDASVKSYGGLVGSLSAELPVLVETPHSPFESNSSDESARSRVQISSTASHATCGVFGFSSSNSSSISGDSPSVELAGCRERFLLRLLQRYPKGHIFNFEPDGAISDTSTGSNASDSSKRDAEVPPSPYRSDSPNGGGTPPPTHSKKRLTAAAQIIKMFPGARSVAIVPLWDARAGRWFAGGFVWTRTPTRIFTRVNELSYLRVFGLAIMAEVAQLKTRAADKAKTDILGSISHELRSPLHGLIGTVEMLRRTTLDGFQESILWTIETSSRTLLDTIDHLLDFVKINNSRSKSRRISSAVGLYQRTDSSAATSLAALGLPEPIQLDLLVEEVVESVLAGSRYLTMSDTHLKALDNGKHDKQLISTRGSVQIYLDIDHLARWSFRAHPGAFRRIVMNLFGNSLKFTTSGFIRISLRQENHFKRQSGISRVVLVVSDSGKGIGEDYLRNHLFTPFSQEDQFASGTGLGLSLVRRMTAALGGSIDVISKVGQGTTIMVALPLSHAVEEPTSEEETDFRQNVASLAGKRVQLRGFESEARVREGFPGDDIKQKSQYRLMKEICRNALRMKVLPEIEREMPTPDFVISISDDGRVDAEIKKYAGRCPHVFVCQDIASAHRVINRNGDMSSMACEVLPLPIGPRKLARALSASQLRWQKAESSGIDLTEGLKSPPWTMPLSRDDEGASTAETSSAELTPLQIPLKQIVPMPTHCSLPSKYTGDPLPPMVQLVVPQPAALLPTQGDPGKANAGRCILVVDDNAINLKILAAFMTKLEHPYTTATNGLEALEMYTKEPSKYCCVLTDISMPVMDGLESTRKIRKFEKLEGRKPTVVIALTGLDGAEIEQDAFASGVDLFLIRPLLLRGLKEALATAGLRQRT